jgi:hypothetical protein
MSGGSNKPWPPLIFAQAPPPWVKSRDHLLTLAMWLVFAIMLETEFELFFGEHLEWLGLGKFDTEANWPEFFSRLMTYLQVAAVLIALLFVATLRTFRRRKQSLLLPSPTPFGIAEEVRRAGLDEMKLIAARAERIVIVHIDAGKQYRIEFGPHPPPV